MLITTEYANLNKHLHDTEDNYGRTVKQFLEIITDLSNIIPTREILDYGCGKRVLERELGSNYQIRNYDPAIPECSTRPEPTDLVVCVDVLEHVEPECLDDVMDDLQRVTRKLCFLSIATIPAGRKLPDGRNTHLVVKPYQWWLPKIWSRFRINQFNNLGGRFLVMAAPPT
jgi:2-polyprenyl-3-methyl-5-hydroxy-6-metoxy-1,4-benzoquinol methylase